MHTFHTQPRPLKSSISGRMIRVGNFNQCVTRVTGDSSLLLKSAISDPDDAVFMSIQICWSFGIPWWLLAQFAKANVLQAMQFELGIRFGHITQAIVLSSFVKVPDSSDVFRGVVMVEVTFPMQLKNEDT